MHVSKALQKAKIVVNEDGTKAAAATSEYLYSEPCLGLKCISTFVTVTCALIVSDMFVLCVCFCA